MDNACLFSTFNFEEEGKMMKKGLYTIIASLFLLSLTVGVAMAGENDGDVAASAVGGDYIGYTTFNLTFNASKGHYGAYAFKVDWDKSLQYFYVRVRDLYLSGDSWVAAFGRRSGAQVITATNQTKAGSPYASGVI